MPKPTATRGWVCAFCTVPVIIVTIALLVVAHGGHRTVPGRVLAASQSSSLPGTVAAAARNRIQASYAALPLAFEQNQGQTDAQVKYLARGSGYTLFLTANDAVFSLHSQAAAKESATVQNQPKSRAERLLHGGQKESNAVVRMHLAGGNSQAKVEGSDALPGTSNYFLGNDPGKWRTGVPRYARVSYPNVYPGVNMAFHGAERQLEFDFVVAAGANPAPIGFQFTGNRGMKTDDSGNLIISSAAGDVLLHKPVAYQEENGARQTVDARFVLKADNQVGFELGNYDRGRELVIDPTVSYAYSTYLGGTGNDAGYGIAFDGSGNAYVTGLTASPTFPGASGSLTDAASAFVTKIASDGSSLVYSTYVGGTGTGSESGNGIAVDASGDAFIAGGTTSSNFPTTSGAYQTALRTGATGNAFITELNPSGTKLTYSTYLGGSGADAALGVALDSSGNVYVVGKTSSANYPLIPSTSALQATIAGGFVSELKPAGGGASDLVFSTYIGGGTNDFAGAVAVGGPSSYVYVTGSTASSGFHVTLTTPPVVQPTFGGISDAFVAVINAAGNAYVYSTFLGGSNIDIGNGIAVDSAGDAYVTGQTASSNTFPLQSPLQPTFGGGPSDAFVTELNPTGTALVYSTYLGGNGQDIGAGIALDANNNAYITGQTNSSPFPVGTDTSTQPTYGGAFDAFVSEIHSGGSPLIFSTYLGGSSTEDNGGDLGAIAVDKPGNFIYVTGNTASTDFPHQSAHQPSNGGPAGTTDAFVVKYAQGPVFAMTASTPAAVSAGGSATSTIALTAYNGYSSPVNLTCSVSGTGSPAPACGTFSTNPLTPAASPGATSTLTITTTANHAENVSPRSLFYAVWLPIAGMSLAGIGFGSTRLRRRKFLGFLMIGMVLAALLVMPACGGSSSKTTPPPPTGGGTPAGTYTVTITATGTDTAATTQTTQVTLTVN